MTKYSRDQGPVCYETSLFWRAGTGMVSDVADRLVRVPLAWWWESERRDGSAIRPLTRLARENAHELLADIAERDADGFGRQLALCGVHPPGQLTSGSLRDVVRGFVDREDGPLTMVIVQPGDHPCELIFVSRDPSAAFTTFCAEFRIRPDAPDEVKPYDALRTARLESFFRLEDSPTPRG